MRHNFKSPLTPANIRYLIRRATFASSSRWRGLLGRFAGVRFIGVTGSAGKTTTTKLIAASLRVAGRVRQTHRLVGQLNDQRFAAVRFRQAGTRAAVARGVLLARDTSRPVHTGAPLRFSGTK